MFFLVLDAPSLGKMALYLDCGYDTRGYEKWGTATIYCA
jgi:hypothetical protein